MEWNGPIDRLLLRIKKIDSLISELEKNWKRLFRLSGVLSLLTLPVSCGSAQNHHSAQIESLSASIIDRIEASTCGPVLPMTEKEELRDDIEQEIRQAKNLE